MDTDTNTNAKVEKEDEIVSALAAHAHAKWLETLVSSETRLKTIESIGSINIAVPWAELHPCWKEVQKKTFWKYLDAFKRKTPEQVAAQVIHTVWMAENEWQKSSSPHLFVDYAALPLAEQQKDCEIAQLILSYF